MNWKRWAARLGKWLLKKAAQEAIKQAEKKGTAGDGARAGNSHRVSAAAGALTLALVVPLSAGPYRTVALADVAVTTRTHVCTAGPVVYVRRQADGDIHVTLDDGRSKVVAEIIPQVPLPAPVKGTRIEVCGVTRIDRWHRTPQYPQGWPEIHPVTSWEAR